jgi:hypothetical protein
MWFLITQNTDFHQKGTEKLFPRYDKCLNCGVDYVEKWCHGRTIKCNVFLLQTKIKNPKHIRVVHLFLTDPRTHLTVVLQCCSERIRNIELKFSRMCLHLSQWNKIYFAQNLIFFIILSHISRGKQGRFSERMTGNQTYTRTWNLVVYTSRRLPIY